MSKSITDKVVRNDAGNRPFSAILETSLSRRTVTRGGLSAALALFAGSSLSACGGGDEEAVTRLGFASLPTSLTDACTVPAGYVAQLLGAWGTPLNDNAADWKSDGTNTSTDLLNATGMHHDGMHYFPLEGSSTEGLLVVNHEYIDEKALHPSGQTGTGVGEKRPAEEVRKEINGHGVSVMHIRKSGNTWAIVKNSRYNRRFTSATHMALAGPVAGTDWVKTPYAPTGASTRGTNNNCGNGCTPWGTYLTAEENWAFVFANTDQAGRPAHQKRLGVPATGRYKWETAAGDATEQHGEFSRFNITPTGASALDDWRNEINGFGYLVEIDPYDPSSVATKRTSMGRFAHEGSAYGNPVAGKPLAFYSGDDSRFEYVYRFVSEAVWNPADAQRSDRLAVGAKYLDKGTLFVAKFNDDGSGVWLPLSLNALDKNGQPLSATFATLDEIIINTRGAADLLGATPMDRPEWTAVHPTNGDVYLTLTNNSSRNDTTGTNAANPRKNNVNGHIVRWHDVPNSNSFKWEIFVFGSDAAAAATTNLSGLTELNQLASPDGLAFDDRGIMWIQTDNGIDGGRNNAVAKTTNDQMLAVIPAAMSPTSTGTGPVINKDNQGDLRRFFVGPNAAEITGFAITPDHKTIFLNIQHPSNWPAYGTNDATVAPTGTVRPRSSTVVIQRVNGGEVGV